MRRSAKRTRTVIVRPARSLARRRDGHPVGEVAERGAQDVVGRSTGGRARTGHPPTTRAGRSRPRRGSAFTARAPSLAPTACPSRLRMAPGLGGRELADGRDAGRRRASSSVFGPTPQRRRTGRGSRNARSSPASTTTSPSGLATCDATLARCLVVATPTEMGSPSSSRTRRADRGRPSIAVIRRGGPIRRRRRTPRRSRCARRGA